MLSTLETFAAFAIILGALLRPLVLAGSKT